MVVVPTSRMTMSDFIIKPRRKKKLDVPVHRNSKEPNIKTYSAQFSGRKHPTKEKSVDFQEYKSFPSIKSASCDDLDLALVDEQENRPRSTSRKKYLKAEIERLKRDNKVLSEKVENIEEHYNKKLGKCKEKVDTVQSYNEEIINQYNILKEHYEELLSNYQGVVDELETCKNCKTCEELKKVVHRNNEDYNRVKAVNKGLTEDVTMLKTVVYRLNVQLERYQTKLRKYNINVKYLDTISNTHLGNPDSEEAVAQHDNITVLSETHRNHPHVPVSWGKVNVHTLGPLLNSYQDTIAEKDDIIQGYECELSNFTGKMEEIVRENEELYKKLTEDEKCSSRLSVEVEKLKNELKLTKEQNDLLIKKCALKQDKLEEVLKCYEQKVEQLKRDYNVVVEQYHKGRTEVVALKEKNKALVESQDEFKNERQNYIPVAVHTASVNECKRWYEELKKQYELEKESMVENVTLLKKEIENMTSIQSELKLENEDLTTKIKNFEKYQKKGEEKYLDLQHTLSQVDLSRSACRKQLHKAMSFAKDLVAEQESLLKALQDRRQENKVVKQLGSDMANRMDILKTQLKSVQKGAWQELSTVDQRLKEQNTIIASMERQHSEEIQLLKQIIREKDDRNLLLQDVPVPNPPFLLLRDRNLI